jgi:stage V sporulation protein SpoVS
MAALDWMDKNLPDNARVAIASADLSLSTSGASMQGTGADAGTWVAPLTSRAIFALAYSTDFIAQSTHDLLCQQQVTHIYIGAAPRSFNSSFADAKPAWYETIFSLPNARIVQTFGCE